MGLCSGHKKRFTRFDHVRQSISMILGIPAARVEPIVHRFQLDHPDFFKRTFDDSGHGRALRFDRLGHPQKHRRRHPLNSYVGRRPILRNHPHIRRWLTAVSPSLLEGQPS